MIMAAIYLCSVAAFSDSRSETITEKAMQNVLLLIVDDLRPNINTYGHSFMSTPNIDKFAKSGTTFTNAYAQIASCGPSRNSFMTGRRPQTTKAVTFSNHFRQVGDDWSSMPQYFRTQGFYTFGTGKVYHARMPPNFDAAKSWDEMVYPGDKYYEDSDTMGIMPTASGGQVAWVDAAGDFEGTEVEGSNTLIYEDLKLTQDEQIRDATLAFLDRAAENRDRPFFAAVGFKKPHLEFQVRRLDTICTR